MVQESFEERLSDRAANIESIISGFLPKEEGYPQTVIEAMNYSILAGGKRIRPVMMQETYRLLTVPQKQIPVKRSQRSRLILHQRHQVR